MKVFKLGEQFVYAGTWDGWLEREQGKKRGREKMNFWVCWVRERGNGDLRYREV
jgi:hypothetical protein